MMMGFHMEIYGTNIWMIFFSRFAPGIACTLPLLTRIHWGEVSQEHMGNYMEIIHELWWVAWFHLQYTCCIPVYPHEILNMGVSFGFRKTSFGSASLVSVDSLKSARSLRVLDIDAWLRSDFFFDALDGWGFNEKRSYTSLPHQKRNICWTQNLANKSNK